MRGRFFLLLIFLGSSAVAMADAPPRFDLTIKDHKFEPAELAVPANKLFIVTIKNLDATAEEIESRELQIEKVIAAHGEGTLHVHALDVGRHDFIGEYHSDSAKGAFIAQ